MTTSKMKTARNTSSSTHQHVLLKKVNAIHMALLKSTTAEMSKLGNGPTKMMH